MESGGDERGFAQRFQHETGGGLGGAVAGEHGLGRRRAKPDGAEGRHPADEAIHQHGHALQRTAQKDAAETRDVKPAKLGEDIQRVVRVGLIDRNAPLNGIDLPGKALIREARAPAGHALHRLAQQHRRHRAGGGGVANAHFARGQQGDALRFLLPHQRDALGNSLHGLLPAHGRALGKIGGAGGNAAVPHAGHRLPGHAHVHWHHLAPGGAGHLADTGAPGGKILRHGAGHALVRLADAPRHHAVVRAEDKDGTLGEIQRRAPGEGGGGFQRGFQRSQPAQRLCQAGPVGMSRRAGGLVRRGDALQQGFECCFCHKLPRLFW